MDGGGVRWKNRDAAAIADADPMSKIIYRLQSSLEQSETCGLFSGSAVLIQAGSELTKLLNRACFGRPIITAPPTSSCSLKGTKYKLEGEQQSADLQWFQLGMEEAFYLNYSLNCLTICRSTREGRQNLNAEEIWRHMKERQKMFLQHYKAYSHLRAKNWVVRSGLQYGADFVAYRHHPALVHSEYAVIISSESDVGQARLTTWSDWQSTLRLCGSVAKTLLVLSIMPRGNKTDETSPTCLDDYFVEEFEIRRWIAEKHREDPRSGKDKTFRRNSWQMWENYSQVAFDIGNFGQALEAIKMVLDLTNNKRGDLNLLSKLVEEMESRKISSGCRIIQNDGTGHNIESKNSLFENDLSKTNTSQCADKANHIVDTVSVHSDSYDGVKYSFETEQLVNLCGKILQQLVQSGEGGGEVWGLYARWHKFKGNSAMCSEALLKQVRAYQGSDVSHNEERFKKFARASVQLCEQYMDIASSTGSKRELSTAQMHLRNAIKQAENFSGSEEYKALGACLQRVQQELQHTSVEKDK